SITAACTLSLHDALPILCLRRSRHAKQVFQWRGYLFLLARPRFIDNTLDGLVLDAVVLRLAGCIQFSAQSLSVVERNFVLGSVEDRKSTRLNSSHVKISY